MLEDMKGHPLSAEERPAPKSRPAHDLCMAPDVGRMAHAPAFHTESAGHLFAAGLEIANQIEQRLGAFRPGSSSRQASSSSGC